MTAFVLQFTLPLQTFRSYYIRYLCHLLIAVPIHDQSVRMTRHPASELPPLQLWVFACVRRLVRWPMSLQVEARKFCQVLQVTAKQSINSLISVFTA